MGPGRSTRCICPAEESALGQRGPNKGQNKLRPYSQVTCIYIALTTIQIVSKQLYSDKQENRDSMMQTEF